jgi:DNA-binding protein HU-beta
MPVKTKKAKTAKAAKKPATKASAKKEKTAKKPVAKKTAKKAAAKKSPAKKTAKKHKQGKRKPAKRTAGNAANKRVAKTPAEKTTWKISPAISQSVFRIDTWKKDNLKIEHLTVYRSGWIIVDQLPDLSGYNQDEGVNIFEEFEFEEHQLYDGAQETSLFPKELPAEDRNRLLALSEAELAEEGWTLESITRFKGPLVLEEV